MIRPYNEAMQKALSILIVMATAGCQQTGPSWTPPPPPAFDSNLSNFEQDGVSVQYQRTSLVYHHKPPLQYGLAIKVSGIITNTTSEPIKLVQLYIDLIDGDNVKLTGSVIGTNNLQAGQSYRFTVNVVTQTEGTYPPILETQKLSIFK